MTKSALCLLGTLLSAASASAFVEREIAGDTTIDVPLGTTNRIDYLSGSVDATITKTGAGTLEIAVLGTNDYTFLVNEGTLRSVEPKLDLGDSIWFHVDASKASTMTLNVQNGTNYVSRWDDAEGRDRYVTPVTGLPSPGPFVSKVTLNGRTTMDFGGLRDVGIYGNPPKGHLDPAAAGFKANEKALVAEIFYIWQDVEGVKDLPLAGADNDTVFVGPTPVNTLACGYRGKGGGGTGFPLWYTAPDRMGLNFYLDDVKRKGTYIPEEGWHLARYCVSPDWDRSSTSSHLSDYGFQGFGYWNSRYGGCRLAEAVLCTNALSTAEHNYVDSYLKFKWFGSAKSPLVSVANGATFDNTESPWRVNRLCTMPAANLVGAASHRAMEISGTNDLVVSVTGTYAAVDRFEAATPSLSFTGAGTVAVASGTARGNAIDAEGTLVKSGAGALEISYLTENVTRLTVAEGSFTLSPLLSAASALHFDAMTNVTTEAFGTTNLVTNWGDVNEGRGSALVPVTANYKFKSGTVHKPFVVANAAGTRPLVDFGGFADYYHTNGNWGAGLDATHVLNGGKTETVLATGDGWRQAFAVWQDDDGAKDLPLVDDAEFTGPSLFGVNNVWTRGKGGAGNGFPIAGTDSAAFRESLFLDGTQIKPVDCRTYRIPSGLHLLDIALRPGMADGIYGVSSVGYKLYTKEGSVYGGVKFGEILFFRHRLPDGQRTKIAAALGVKWLGTSACRLEQAFDSLSVADGASAAFPYADVTVTNLTASGAISARSLTVASGGTLTITGSAGAVSCLGIGAISFAGRGTLVVSADVAGTIVLPIKVIAAADGPSVPTTVRGWKTASGVKAILVRKSDGYYLTKSPGLVVIIR